MSVCPSHLLGRRSVSELEKQRKLLIPKPNSPPSLLMRIHFSLTNQPNLLRSNDYLQQKWQIGKDVAFVIIFVMGKSLFCMTKVSLLVG